MDVSNLQIHIYEFLNIISIREDNIKLNDLLNKQDLYELSVKLSYTLPDYPDRIIKETKEEVLDVFKDNELNDFIHKNILNLLRLYLSNKINKEQQSLLIFYLSLTLKEKYKTDVNNELKNVKDFILSYLIKNQNKLIYEIEKNKLEGITENFKSKFIRRTGDFNLIPTSKTLEKFSNYLIKI